ncbi:MAG: glycosyltransferase [Desulfobacterota bacterium]|nr:glycosyltransferase [Thermodesulfobacteriota bacterium]MDW8001325.1 glycosyltransferase family 2 protein [Deltaproteobacteria bacterium]
MRPLTLVILPSFLGKEAKDDDLPLNRDAFQDVKIVSRANPLEKILKEIRTDYFFVAYEGEKVEISEYGISELLKKIELKDAGIVYSDYICEKKRFQLNDYLLGSCRDDFDFGSLMVFSTEKVRAVLKKYGNLSYEKYGAFYDLRLKLSIDYPIVRVAKPLYEVKAKRLRSPKEAIFFYVDPENLNYQLEMEKIFTRYLKKIGAYIPHERLKTVEDTQWQGPYLATVVIPVKNREKTILEALKSALAQKTDFPFNIIVVDNHSTDRTGEIVDEFSKRHKNITRIVPTSLRLKIGGCWNEAINHPLCGKYAIQLDSDDLYDRSDTLQVLVDNLRKGKYAMVVGSYRTVDEELREIPPYIVDHKEWTETNGHNNLLRVGGIGAPRAFVTRILRKFKFKNLSYGEDYAMALRISREYRIGRIYEPLYMARRWAGNTDSNIDHEGLRVLLSIKDKIRTHELEERIKMCRSDPKISDQK